MRCAFENFKSLSVYCFSKANAVQKLGFFHPISCPQDTRLSLFIFPPRGVAYEGSKQVIIISLSWPRAFSILPLASKGLPKQDTLAS